MEKYTKRLQGELVIGEQPQLDFVIKKVAKYSTALSFLFETSNVGYSLKGTIRFLLLDGQVYGF